MTQATSIPRAAEAVPQPRPPRDIQSLWRSMEIELRLVGMIAALAIIWLGFHILSGGLFLTPRNLWNLSVQSASIAIMATGMVLIIVSRNIDLSVGSLLGFLGYTMAMVQVQWIPTTLHLGFGQPYTWVVALLVGLVFGAGVGAFQGVIIAYGGVPAFIVTLGGFLVWRGLIFAYAQGQTIAPMDPVYALLGGGPIGSVGEWPSWIIGVLACVGICYTALINRRRRREFAFIVPPVCATATILVVSCAAVLGQVWIANHYFLPDALAHQYAVTNNIAEPAGGLQIPVGIAIPVLIMIGVALLMTFIATRRRFGRYVFAIGGNPDAAGLAGIHVRRTSVLRYVLMGVLVAISAAVQTARLNSAVTNLGIQNELDVISAAGFGGGGDCPVHREGLCGGCRAPL